MTYLIVYRSVLIISVYIYIYIQKIHTYTKKKNNKINIGGGKVVNYPSTFLLGVGGGGEGGFGPLWPSALPCSQPTITSIRKGLLGELIVVAIFIFFLLRRLDSI